MYVPAGRGKPVESQPDHTREENEEPGKLGKRKELTMWPAAE